MSLRAPEKQEPTNPQSTRWGKLVKTEIIRKSGQRLMKKEIYEEPQWNEDLVLQKDKQYWQILRQITQKKKRPKLIKLGMKRDIVQQKLKKFKEPWGHSLYFTNWKI